MATIRYAPLLLATLTVPALLVATACGPLLGLDSLGVRPPDAGTEDRAPVPGGSECTSNEACIQKFGGQTAAVCVSGACVEIDDAFCPKDKTYVFPSLDALAKEDAILVPAFVPVRGASPDAQGPVRAYKLGLEELERAGGVPGPEERRRHLAMILCASEPDVVHDAMRYVADELHAPAVIAGFNEPDLLEWMGTHAKPKGVFTLNPGVATDAIRYGDFDGLVWNILGTPEDVALAYRPLLSRVERWVHALRRDPPGTPLRVALLRTNTTTEDSVANVVQLGPLDRSPDAGSPRDSTKAIAFNGDLSAAENASNGNFLFVPVGALENGETPDYTGIRQKLTDFRPDVVIALTRDEIAQIVTDYESAIDAGSDSSRRPIWLLSSRNHRVDKLLAYLASNANELRTEKLKRFLGVQFAGAADPEQRAQWLARMNAEYPSVPESSYSATENFYDAVYWIAYGLAAGAKSKEGPPSGRDVRDGVETLLRGPKIYAGPTDTIHEAFRLIGVETETTYVGALGPPDIAAKFGTWNSVGGVYCYQQDASGAIAPKYDVLRYDRSTGGLVGEFDCFISAPAF